MNRIVEFLNKNNAPFTVNKSLFHHCHGKRGRESQSEQPKMAARWDAILTLPVQSPPTPEFSSADIVWSRVEGWQEGVDKVALIPFSRVTDYVRGESNRKECPTRFHVEARRRRSSETSYKPKVDGILEYILYWCSFGPDDHRKGGVVRPSRHYAVKKKTPAGRPSTKRGCVCHFIVKRLIAEPSVALIIYNFEKHIDKQGLPCHGPQDKMSVGTRAMFAPYISEEFRLQLTSLLYVGVPVETIMQRHMESVEKQGGPSNRDDLLTHRCVRRLERKIRRSTCELDPDDATSISLWVESHPSDVFFYKDYSDTEPFVLGIQTEWQLQQMIQFGNQSIITFDSSFGANKLMYPVQSLLVFDQKNNAIPVAWIITPRFASCDTYRWLRALYDRIHSKDTTWRLGGFIVDDPSSDVHLIREVFQCSVLISFWRVRRAWHKNLMSKCSNEEIRVEISRRLGSILSCICRKSLNVEDAVDAFDNFFVDFIDNSLFVDYFKATWFHRIGTWIDALKTLPLATIETSAAIESYHYQMKLRLMNETNPNVYQRADWLAYKLGSEVHSYYWLDGYAEKESFVRYWKNEWKSGFTAWQRALQIPDMDVIVSTGYATVASKNKENHTVLNPGSEFAICDCKWSKMGNLCKHTIKVLKIYRERGLTTSSISIFHYTRTLNNILHCPPPDSLIRDHSVVLALSVQMQLNALLNPETTRSGLSSVPFVTESHLPTDSEDVPNCNGIEESDLNPNNETSSMIEIENSAGIFISENTMGDGAQPIQSQFTDENNNDPSTQCCLNANASIELDESFGKVCPNSTPIIQTFLGKPNLRTNDSTLLIDRRGEFSANLVQENRHYEAIVSSRTNHSNNDYEDANTVDLISDKVMNIDVEKVVVQVQSSPSTSKESQICSFQQYIIVPCQKNACDGIEGDSDAMIIETIEAEDHSIPDDITMGSLDKGHGECCLTENSRKEINATEASTDDKVGCMRIL